MFKVWFAAHKFLDMPSVRDTIGDATDLPDKSRVSVEVSTSRDLVLIESRPQLKLQLEGR